MELPILTPTNTITGKKQLPQQFSEEIREDIIKRAVEALRANKRQKYGADLRAGKKSSAKLSRRRRDYKGAYGHGISRVPRKTLSRNGAHFNWAGAYAPGTVGGRRAFPPKPMKNWTQKINDKERKKAIRSAMSATLNKELVQSRGHKLPKTYPFIASKEFETIATAKELTKILQTHGFEEELKRSAEKKIRAGKGKMRGRKYTHKKGILIVTTKDTKLLKSARNLPGTNVVDVTQLNTELLAPGTKPGRLTIFTQTAIEQLEKTKLFM
ncbi:50S ribosomal protein L4 [Candidatus Woesearchaeota archaeon]|nr:50S ribosomal protein L4 [Candidatus Woesearchaeota archaeon]